MKRKASSSDNDGCLLSVFSMFALVVFVALIIGAIVTAIQRVANAINSFATKNELAISILGILIILAIVSIFVVWPIIKRKQLKQARSELEYDDILKPDNEEPVAERDHDEKISEIFSELTGSQLEIAKLKKACSDQQKELERLKKTYKNQSAELQKWTEKIERKREEVQESIVEYESYSAKDGVIPISEHIALQNKYSVYRRKFQEWERSKTDDLKKREFELRDKMASLYSRHDSIIENGKAEAGKQAKIIIEQARKYASKTIADADQRAARIVGTAGNTVSEMKDLIDQRNAELRKLYAKIEDEHKHLERLEQQVEAIELSRLAMIDEMNGHDFERWCASLLRKNKFFDVSVTKGSGDQGVDVLATKDSVKYAIQCKCYSSDLGNTPVQEVHAGKSFYDCHVGVVMTNRYFTGGAKDLAEKTGVLLWDRDKLTEMLNNVL